MAHPIGKTMQRVASAAKVPGAGRPVPARPAARPCLSATPALRPELASAISTSSRAQVRVISRKSSVIVQAAGSNGAASNRTPSAHVLKTWKEANAVCFDVDCTITINDTLDLLAEFMGCGEAVAKLTDKAMDGTMNLKESLDERLKILNCKPDDIKRFVKAHPPEKRLTPGIVKLVKDLQARGVVIYLITGGFREIMAPVAEYLGVPMTHVYANRMLWQWDELTLQPTRLVGFDLNEPTAHNQGKPQAIAKIREKNPYNTVVMIGDGITDLEAVQVTGGADLFIGYGGVAERPAVVEGADWYITDWAELDVAMKRHKVAVVGSGAWATAAVRMAGQNTQEDPSDEFDEKISMWVYEEEFNGRKLTEVINETHENPKYLPGAKLPENVVANPDLIKTVEDADIIVICCPHQFVRGLCKQMAGKIKPGAIAISLIKGMRVRSDGPQLISQMVSRSLGIDCSVLMGANIADGIAKEELSEAVIGYTNRDNAKLFKKLFQRPYFKVNLLPDAAGAEMCGTLKNIVALGAGLIDGMGLGANSKAAILRQGLYEMKKFSQALYPSIRDQTFLESCGIADLVSTCYGGRNRRVAAAYMEAFKAGKPESFAALEARLLNGQKLQGVQTSDEVQEILRLKGWEQEYPLFTTINRIVNQQIDPTYITKYEQGAKLDISDQEPQEQLPVVLASGEALHSGEFNKKYGPLSLTL